MTLAVIGASIFAIAEDFITLVMARVLIGMGVSACLMAAFSGFRAWYATSQQGQLASAMLVCVGWGASLSCDCSVKVTECAVVCVRVGACRLRREPVLWLFGQSDRVRCCVCVYISVYRCISVDSCGLVVVSARKNKKHDHHCVLLTQFFSTCQRSWIVKSFKAHRWCQFYKWTIFELQPLLSVVFVIDCLSFPCFCTLTSDLCFEYNMQ